MENRIFSKNDLLKALFIFNSGQPLTRPQAESALGYLFSEDGCHDRETYLGALLTAPMSRGVTSAEVNGYLDAVVGLDAFFKNPLIRPELPDNSIIIGALGSGKKGIKTINVSTLSGLVVASCGFHFSKPVSKSTSSLTGSSDILTLCGVEVGIPRDEMMGILTEIKFGAFSIEQQIPEFDKFYGGKFWAPHALSLALPALLSPVQLDHLVFGISAAPIKVSAQVLAERGIKNFTVVSATPDGIRYIDEASLLGKTSWITVKEGKIVKTGSADLGFDHNMSVTEEIDIRQRTTREEHVEVFTSIASGKMPGRYEDMICLNAAFMMQCAGAVKTIDEGIIKSRDAIRHGAPRDILNKLIKATNG